MGWLVGFWLNLAFLATVRIAPPIAVGKSAACPEGAEACRVGAVIPAYQAEGVVGAVVEQTIPLVGAVIVVDDGSTDDTGDEARAAGAIVLAHEHNMGKGAALSTGIRALLAAGADAVVTLDADGQHLPGEIPRLLEAYYGSPGTGIVLGTREHLFPEMSALRRRANSISSSLISIAAGLRLPDVQTGFRIYDRKVAQDFAMPGTGFEAESAIVVLAARAGFGIVSLPVELGFVDGRSTSHYRPIRDSIRVAKAVIAARLRRPRRPRGSFG